MAKNNDDCPNGNTQCIPGPVGVIAGLACSACRIASIIKEEADNMEARAIKAHEAGDEIKFKALRKAALALENRWLRLIGSL